MVIAQTIMTSVFSFFNDLTQRLNKVNQVKC